MALDYARLRDIEERQLTRRSHASTPPWWSWGIYGDGTGIQFGVTWDDTLKKDERFCNFAQDVAQAILGESWKVGFGKWGAAIWEDDNPDRTIEDFQEAAEKVRKHPSWLALAGVTQQIRKFGVGVGGVNAFTGGSGAVLLAQWTIETLDT